MTSDKPSEQALLAEYAVCQREAGDCVHASWQSGLVLFVTTLTLAGTVIYSLLNTNANVYRLIIVLVLGGFSITLLIVWIRYLTRQHLIRRVMFHRMVEIEKELNLRKSSYVTFVDSAKKEDVKDWEDGKWFPLVEEAGKKLWGKYQNEPGRGPQGYKLTKRMAFLAIIAWGIFILSEILIYSCPLIRNCFLDCVL
ncbi:MAG: hypothetical protein PVJ61_05970 [Dehalococcoidia bacterium]|jgi:hypothetical protein